MLQTGLIVGGWDKYEGGKIYGIPLGGTVVEQPFAIGGKYSIVLCLIILGFNTAVYCSIKFSLLFTYMARGFPANN